jgi:hypothetical protein
MQASSDPAASAPPPLTDGAESHIGQLAAEQTTTIRLTGAVVLLAVVLVAMAGLLWVDRFTDKQDIHYVSVGTGIGISRPGEVPTGAAEAFAQAVILHMGNVTPATVESVYTDIERYLHPHFVPQFKARAKREIAYVKENHIASLVSIRGVVIERDDHEKRLNRAKVDAVRRVYVGESMVREEVIEVPVAFFPAAVTSLNIYGLLILELQFPQLGRPLEPREAAGLHERRN